MRVVPGEPRITYSIDFSHPLIQRQRFTVPLASEDFEREIAPARTFGFLKEVQYLKTNDLALLGLPVYGRLEVSRGSHEFHCRFLQHLMGQEAAWRIWVPSPHTPQKQSNWFQPTLWEGAPA